MLPSKHPAVFLSLATLLLSAMTACANSPVGKNLEQSLAADPQLKDNPVSFSQPVANTNPQNTTAAQLPANFPTEIPRYPQAQLQEVTQQGTAQVTRWNSTDPINLVQNFYQTEFQKNNWEILSQPTNEAGNLVARRNGLQVTVAIQPAANQTASAATQFTIEYVQGNSETAAQPGNNNPTATPEPNPTTASTPTPSPTVAASPTTAPQAGPSSSFSDLNKAPQELRTYISELGELGVLTINPDSGKSNSSTTNIPFEPNKIISRRDYARWLVAANNLMYANNPAKQIRLATGASQPAFQDVPRTHPDFGVIQGLAEAGLIPSPLSGDSTAVLFRPGVPLTREQMMLWKVPLDTRQSLPNATVDAVKQTWGFQDAGKINPKALRAILADFQNGDVSNIRRVFGFTTLFQPQKPVTRAEAAATLWYFGTQGEGISAKEILQVKRQGDDR